MHNAVRVSSSDAQSVKTLPRDLMCILCAVVASGQAVSNPDQARKLGHASLGVSVAGIIVTIIIVIIVMSVIASKQNE